MHRNWSIPFVNMAASNQPKPAQSTGPWYVTLRGTPLAGGASHCDERELRFPGKGLDRRHQAVGCGPEQPNRCSRSGPPAACGCHRRPCRAVRDQRETGFFKAPRRQFMDRNCLGRDGDGDRRPIDNRVRGLPGSRCWPWFLLLCGDDGISIDRPDVMPAAPRARLNHQNSYRDKI